jgi:photosystem II stability/assembly factor-like uncharacterized protein
MLKQVLDQKRTTVLEALSDAGYDTAKFNERGAPVDAGGSAPMQKPIPGIRGGMAESTDGGKTWKRVK